MLVDSHTHIFPPSVRERRGDYLRRDPGFAELYSSPRARMATADELVASMDRAGVDASIAMGYAWTEQALCRESNDYLLEAAARYPGRLLPFVAVQPLAGQAALRELERCAQAGARGVGELRPYAQGYGLADRALERVMELAQGLGLPVLVHASEPVGHPYKGKGTTTPEVLYPFVQRHPDQTLILAHWGGGLPFYALMPEVMAALQGVFFDTAASSLLYHDSVFRAAPGIVGSEHILWGSDFPLLDQDQDLARVRRALPPEWQDDVLGGNAARLLKLGAAAGPGALGGESYSFATLPDILQAGLQLVFVGLNPSLYSVQQGHYFARKTNRFWPALSSSKLSARARAALGRTTLAPADDARLLALGMGFTDVVKRPGNEAAALRPADFREWAPRLVKRLERCRPRVACFHGVMAFRAFLKYGLGRQRQEDVALGPQALRLGVTRLFVVPNPSPANAHFTLADQVAWYGRLADFLSDMDQAHG